MRLVKVFCRANRENITMLTFFYVDFVEEPMKYTILKKEIIAAN